MLTSTYCSATLTPLREIGDTYGMRGAWFKQKQYEWEKTLLVQLLTEHGGNIWHIAKAIDERRSRLYRMFRRHSLKPADYRVKNADPR